MKHKNTLPPDVEKRLRNAITKELVRYDKRYSVASMTILLDKIMMPIAQEFSDVLAEERVKNESFKDGYRRGKLAGKFKERIKNDPKYLDKSLKKVVNILTQGE